MSPMTAPTESAAVPEGPRDEPEWLALVRAHVKDLRYGVVQLVVHDGRVTQIERTEKTRLSSDRPDRASR
jgi:hypothetical protein